MRLRLAVLTGVIVFLGYAIVASIIVWAFTDFLVARFGDMTVVTPGVEPRPGEPMPDGAISVEFSQVLTKWTRVAVIGTAPLAGLATGVAAWFVAGRVLRPVSAIEQRFRSLASGDLSLRVPEPGGGDEVARLARTMNETLGRLEESAGRQRRFIADAAHELRGPIGAVRTDLEVAARYPDRVDIGAALQEALVDVERLQAVATDLLTLARLESGEGAPQTEVALSDAVGELVIPAHVQMAIDVCPDAVVAGSRAQLVRLLQNLVDNAARHARSQVALSVSVDGTVVRIDVDDDGPGISRADRERVFERFFRVGGARSRDDGGAGLGLAIVAEIARAHGGTAVAARSPLGGARLRIELPPGVAAEIR